MISETLFKTIIAVLGMVLYVINMGKAFATGLDIVTLHSKRKDMITENRSIYCKYSRICCILRER